MEYISIKEAAAQWTVSERLVQRYCVEGRIEGAVKQRGAWAIPSDAQKPADPRKKDAAKREIPSIVPQVTGVIPEKSIPMPLLNMTFTPGHCMDAVIQIADADLRNIALCEYYFFSGQAEKAAPIAERYLTHEDINLRLSACWLYAYANLALNRIENARKTLALVQVTLAGVDENTPAEQRALAVCVSTGAAVLLHLPLPEGVPPLRKFLGLLPPGLRLFALYVQAHEAYLNKRYWESVGIAETALVLEDQIYPIPSIYLHLVAAMSCMSTRDQERGREHLLAAWELARPDDLIEAFGEHHGLLGGLLEAVIKKDWPEDFKRIIAITYAFSAGWRKIHNPDTGHNVADDLTTTEFAVAMLAARGWSNKEISGHLGVSPNTVKHHISAVLQKLGIVHRDELVQFMLK